MEQSREQVMINGVLYQKEKAAISVFDHGLLYGDGIYTTMRTYKGKLFLPEEYLARMYQQAKKINLKIIISQQKLLQQIIKTIQVNAFPESRVRVTVTRGVGTFQSGSAARQTIIIYVVRLEGLPKECYEQGVRIITVNAKRLLPEIKSTSQITTSLAKQQAVKRRAYDALLVDEQGEVREATIANIFFIKNNILYTPGEKILQGVTRDIILKIAKPAMKIQVCRIKKEQAYLADECFLTNTTKGIIPVTKIDNKKVGRGIVGDATKRLMRCLKEWIQEAQEHEKKRF